MVYRYIRLFHRRSPLRPSRWRFFSRLCSKTIFMFVFISFFITLFHAIYILGPNYLGPHSSDIIVSLTSAPKRFQYELPLTIHSLLSQTLLPKQIRIYLSPTSEIIQQENLTLSHLKINVRRLDSSNSLMKIFDRLVDIRLEGKDYGPATKYIPIIKEFSSKQQVIMICDDDQYYHPYTVETFNEYSSIFPNSIIGFRGWRGMITPILIERQYKYR